MANAVWIVIITLYFAQSEVSTESEICEDLGIIFDEVHNNSIIANVINGEAFIPCRFEYHPTIKINNQDPTPTPFWRVQNNMEQKPRFYYPGRLPSNFYYNASLGGLTISNIDESMDNSSVSCCFEFFDFNSICEASPVYIIIRKEPMRMTTTHVYNPSLSSRSMLLSESTSISLRVSSLVILALYSCF